MTKSPWLNPWPFITGMMETVAMVLVVVAFFDAYDWRLGIAALLTGVAAFITLGVRRSDAVTIGDLLRMLRAAERKAVQSVVVDNQRPDGLWLTLYGDGSGYVECEWRHTTENETDTEQLFRAIFTDESPLLEFESTDELVDFLRERETR